MSLADQIAGCVVALTMDGAIAAGALCRQYSVGGNACGEYNDCLNYIR